MRRSFDKQLEILNSELIKMGSLCEDAIAMSAKALTETDIRLEKGIEKAEAEIDEKEKEIETLCLKLLLRQQPVAGDLRQISAAIKMITDMERIGDQARDIAELLKYIRGHRTEELILVHNMAEEAAKMVTDSIEAYVTQNQILAADVIAHDDIIDDLFERVRQALICFIRETGNDAEYAVDLLMVAKYFERIGDHAVNIAEWVVFSLTGVHKGDAKL